MSSAPSDHVLREFLALRRRDRFAIATLLSSRERQLLDALAKPQRRPADPLPKQDAAPDFSVYSPWLAKHLLRLVAEAEAGQSALTPMAQEALHACLLQRRHPGAAG